MVNLTQDFKIHLVGHDWALELLRRQQQQERMPQSLLLTGLPNVGKSTLGKYLAQSLNCLNPPGPCGRCSSCRKVVSGNHPDVRIFDQAPEPLKIDQVRELQRELALSPHESRHRVAVLCQFERATTGAANALLKTLEEPPPQVVLILTATDPAHLLPTIVSRCQLVALRPVSRPEIQQALQTRWQANPAQAELLAQLAAGRLGWAVNALQDEGFLEWRRQLLDELLTLLHQGRAERLAYAYEMGRNRGAIGPLLGLWLTIWRDLLLLKSGSRAKIVNLDWQELLQPVADRLELDQVQQAVTRLHKALVNLEYNVNPRLNLEVVLLKLPIIT